MPMTAPEIPYQPRATQEYKRELRRYYILFLIATALSTFVVIGFLLFVMPWMKEIFKDFRTSLPAVTEWVLTIAEFCHDGWWLAVLPVAFAVPFLGAKIVADQKSEALKVIVAMLFFLLLFIAMTGFLVAMTLAIFLPLVKLVQSINGVGP